MALSPNPLLYGDGWIGSNNVGCSTCRLVGGLPSPFLPVPGSSPSSSRFRIWTGFRVRALNSSDEKKVKDDAGVSFLKMWESAKQGRREAKNEPEDWARREKEFQSILQVPREERNKVQQMELVNRASAALAAVNALLAEYPAGPKNSFLPNSNAAALPPAPQDTIKSQMWIPTSVVEVRPPELSTFGGRAAEDGSPSSSRSGFQGAPGPDFWSWVPPPRDADDGIAPGLKLAAEKESKPLPTVLEKDTTSHALLIPFETDSNEDMSQSSDLPVILQNRAMPSVPPLQSLLEVEKKSLAEREPISEVQLPVRMPSVDTETGSAVNRELWSTESSLGGVQADGSRWWEETGVEYREGGVVCKWTVVRGVSADEGTEWEEKFWEAFDPYDYKELGAEKSGRDSSGRVWREFWRESMWQDAINGLQHVEKTADKWGRDAAGGQWHEKWFEHYDASGRTEKWADKWSQIDSDTHLEPGHAHTWRERWGEIFDGHGDTMKYTDKWAERKGQDDVWTKWGDKWDEHFDREAHGVKQGETWWEGVNGEKWNRTWGEEHNGTGWIHKYGKSSSGEHWDTHEQGDTWYEKKPHFGLRECLENSCNLRKVNEKRKRQL